MTSATKKPKHKFEPHLIFLDVNIIWEAFFSFSECGCRWKIRNRMFYDETRSITETQSSWTHGSLWILLSDKWFSPKVATVMTMMVIINIVIEIMFLMTMLTETMMMMMKVIVIKMMSSYYSGVGRGCLLCWCGGEAFRIWRGGHDIRYHIS